MASVSPPSRARSADRLSSSRFIGRASGQSLAKEASIGTIGMFQGVDQGNAHARTVPAAARPVSIPPRLARPKRPAVEGCLRRLDARREAADLVAERFRTRRQTVGGLQNVGCGLAGLIGCAGDADDIVGDVLRAGAACWMLQRSPPSPRPAPRPPTQLSWRSPTSCR